MVKGRLKYCPAELLGEINIVKKRKKVGDSEAMREIVGYSQVGRELERINPLSALKPNKRRRRSL